MYKIELGKSGIEVPTIAVGCMRISNMSKESMAVFINTAIENGAYFFDHADIYDGGKCENLFGEVVSSSLRDKLIIQTKCGIVPGKMFDFSYEHIIRSAEESLKRLKTDYIDVFLLHRPDALVEPDEVARAFDELKASGKVRAFGVSNQNPYQMQLLQNSLDMPLCVNQLQFGIMHTPMIQAGINVNMYNDSAVGRDGGVLDYCRLNKITVQPWSPVQYGFFEGCFIDNEKFPELNRTMDEIAGRYGVNKNTIAFAWILRHPAKMQPVTGTTNVDRLKDYIKATEISLTREEWYDIYRAAGNILP
ncbi:MAG: aldo/keto reductase [Lachnospiraceae bacterium]|nr:aldo/keto reductase [Lachnospiraceae bacterium]